MISRILRNTSAVEGVGVAVGAGVLQFVRGMWLYLRPDKSVAEAVRALRSSQLTETEPVPRTESDLSLLAPMEGYPSLLRQSFHSELSPEQHDILERAMDISRVRYNQRLRIDLHLIAPILMVATKHREMSKRNEWAHLVAYSLVKPHGEAIELSMLLSSLDTEELNLLRSLRLRNRDSRYPDPSVVMAPVLLELLSAFDAKGRGSRYVSGLGRRIVEIMRREGIGALVSLYLSNLNDAVSGKFTDPRFHSGDFAALSELSLLTMRKVEYGTDSAIAKLAVWHLSPLAHRLLDVIDDLSSPH